MENKSKPGSKRRTTRQSRRGTSIDSSVFHPTRPSFYHSFSTDSETTLPFCANSNPYQSSNSTILSSLLNQDDDSILPNSSFQAFSCGPGVSFPHPPAQFVEELSVQAGSYTSSSSAESLNWFGSQQNLLDLWNPPILFLFLRILLFLYQAIKIHLFYSQFNRTHSPHPCLNKTFLLLILLAQMPSLACRDFAQTFHFLLIPLTLAHLASSIWLQLLFPGRDVHTQF